MTNIITIPTGSIISSLGLFLAFITFIGWIIFKSTNESPNRTIWHLFSYEIWGSGGLLIWLMSYFIMVWSEPFDFYIVSRAFFYICSVIFGIVGIAGLIGLVITSFIVGYILIMRGGNGTKN